MLEFSAVSSASFTVVYYNPGKLNMCSKLWLVFLVVINPQIFSRLTLFRILSLLYYPYKLLNAFLFDARVKWKKITSLATLSVIWQTYNKKCAGQLNAVARKNEWLVLRSLFVFVVGRQHQAKRGNEKKKHIQNKEMDGKYTTNTSEIQLNKQIVCSWSWKSKITKRKVIFEHTNAHTHIKNALTHAQGGGR